MDRRTFIAAGAGTAATLGLGTAAMSPAHATPSRGGGSGSGHRQLMGWFADTHRSLEAMTSDLGLPSDTIEFTGADRPVRSRNTSPTNIGCLLWTTVAAAGLGLLDRATLRRRLHRTVEAVEGLERAEGFWLNWYDPRDGSTLTEWPETGEEVRPFLSSVDNAWLVAGLRIAAEAEPTVRGRVARLLKDADWSFFYTPYDPDDPVAGPGQLRGGYWTDTGKPTDHHYGALNSETRIASYLGIGDGSLPAEHYWCLLRTMLPEHEQEQPPKGRWRTVDGVRLWQGYYTYRGRKVIPSWGGSMFEALMPALLIPEREWSPRSWRVSQENFIRGQIEHGLVEAEYGYWGFSPCNVPEGGYQEYGVDALGLDVNGYCSNTDRTSVTWGEPLPPASDYTNGVVTPHAAFLALPYAHGDALRNLRALDRDFDIYQKGYGFRDSVNVSTGRVSDFMLALDQGMIAAALAQRLRPGLLQRAFARGEFGARIRPLVSRERFWG